MRIGILHRSALCAALLLGSCSPAPAEDSATVLGKAVAKAHTLESAVFSAKFSYEIPTPYMSFSAGAEGSLADGGRQLKFSFDAKATTAGDPLHQTISVEGDVIVADEQETYLRLDSVIGSVPILPGIGLVPAEMLGTWFRIGSSSTAGTVTPDPSIMAMQTEALMVTRDRSFEKVGGRDCYAYDVTIDRSKLLTLLEKIAQERGEPFDRVQAEKFLSAYEARGTIWIDAQTYVIREIAWIFENAPGSPVMEASLNMQLRDHDEAVEIVPPADAVPYSDTMNASSLPLF